MALHIHFGRYVSSSGQPGRYNFALGINPWYLIAMFPAVNCLFILPTTGPALAAVGMDRSGTTYIGKYILNHSFQLPGLVMVAISVVTAFGLVSFFA